MGLLKKLFGTSSEKELRAIKPIVDKIEALDGEYSKLTDEQLKAKTPEFKQRIANGESLDDILPEAFAACREAAWRVLGMKPYRVQLIGGIILHQGRIAEMKTGEGKTLVATLPAYLNALAGEGVHIVTVNDYLAKRDSEWMGKVYRFLGLTVGLVIHDIQPKDRKASYSADITYGTNNEFGFDYLRDNMAIYATEMVQRGHAFAIVDEVDSILIDEARTPLIISGQGDKSTQLYTVVDAFVAKLKGQRVASVDTKEEEDPDLDADYVVDEKARTVTLTARGIAKAEARFHVDNLSDPENTTLSHHINQAIRARGLMRRDIDYVVKDGEVIIVDEFTGRLMYGRRYSEGLHQAIEAKEGVTVARESKTLATITFQNYFRLYGKLSGMTGTAMTEEEEFGTIYSLDIVEIPTNKPVQRVDHPDVVYKTEAGKFRAIVNQIEECHKKGQPVLVGTISIEKSEELSAMLKKRGIKHNVLNAKFHEKEAEIVAQAGKLGAVTVATNMAGRGTDIMLGGNAEYLAKAELRKAGLSDELIAESTGYADTDNEEILNARKMFAEAEELAYQAVKAGKFFTMIGGDHSVTIPVHRGVNRAVEEDFGIIHIDAHFDLCHEMHGDILSHGSTERRATELSHVGDSDHLYFLGIRSIESDELEFYQNNKINVLSAADVDHLGVPAALERMVSHMKRFSKVYITLDIDCLDPAYAAGTGTPQFGGLTARQLLDLLKGLFDGLNIIGMDVVEVAPRLDPSLAALFAARKIITECWAHHYFKNLARA